MLSLITTSVIDSSAVLLEQAKLQPGGFGAGDDFGWAVDIDGNIAVVGAPDAGPSDRGQVYIYTRTAGVWSLQQTIDAPYVDTNNTQFGRSVAVAGTTVVIGAPRRNWGAHPEQGRVYVYTRSAILVPNPWSLEAAFSPSDINPVEGEDNAHFGWSVAIDGNTLLAGAPNRTWNLYPNGGRTYAFTRVGNNWNYDGSLLGETDDDGQAGWAVALDANDALVGVPGYGAMLGRVELYHRTLGVWSLVEAIAPGGLEDGDQYGYSVALEGGFAAAGAPFAGDVEGGRAISWQRHMGAWLPEGVTFANADSHYGTSVALVGNRLAVGQPDFAPAGLNPLQGRVRLYRRLSTDDLDNFGVIVNTTPGTGTARFGRSVAATSTDVIVGAPGENAVYIFNAVAPSVTTIHPNTGTIAGDSDVGLTGTNLVEQQNVYFDGLQATVLEDTTATTLRVQTPPHAAGLVDVSLIDAWWANTVVYVNAFTYVAGTPTDQDADTLPDAWETQWGVDPTSPGQHEGPLGDPDGDGIDNEHEYQNGTHPRGFLRYFLAEGATGPFFDTTIALVNPSSNPLGVGHTQLRYLKSDGTVITQALILNPPSRATVSVDGIAGLEDAEFSTAIESDQLLGIDRTMRWDTSGYGAHGETALWAQSTLWYLAEGSTAGSFQLFYLLQNAGPDEVSVTVEFLRPAGLAPIVKPYTLPPHSRTNIWVNQADPELASTDVSARITSSRPIVVERAMYLNSGGQLFGAGHESAGVRAADTSWFLAEGATGAFFDLFTLIANVSNTDAQVSIQYLLPSGDSLTKNYVVAANSRFNVWVDLEDAILADTAVSQVITSINAVPIVVERAMWWPGTSATWHEAHASAGARLTNDEWVAAAGETGGPAGVETYILIANTSPFAAGAEVTLIYEDGGTEVRTFPLNPSSRFNVSISVEFASSAGRRFGTVVRSVDTGSGEPELVVEHAMYSNANGVIWAAGTNNLATPMVPVAVEVAVTEQAPHNYEPR